MRRKINTYWSHLNSFRIHISWILIPLVTSSIITYNKQNLVSLNKIYMCLQNFSTGIPCRFSEALIHKLTTVIIGSRWVTIWEVTHSRINKILQHWGYRPIIRWDLAIRSISWINWSILIPSGLHNWTNQLNTTQFTERTQPATNHCAKHLKIYTTNMSESNQESRIFNNSPKKHKLLPSWLAQESPRAWAEFLTIASVANQLLLCKQE